MYDWQRFYEITKNRPPSDLLIRAMRFVEKKDNALDLGAGALKDSKYLVKAGFKKVFAVDQENPPTDVLKQIVGQHFVSIISKFDQFEFVPNKYNLINAQYSLPFISPALFTKVWNNIKNSLAPGGVFTAQFFGDLDEWSNSNPTMTFHPKKQVEQLLTDLEVLEFTEEEKDGQTADGSPKHWHIFHVIAKRNRQK